MKIGYLLNSYPMTSTTFIRREIETLEELGLQVQRYGVRHWDQPLVDPLDVAEQARTHYLLTGNASNLVRAFVRELLDNPRGLWRGVLLWAQLCRERRELSARQFAYLLQAAYLRQRAVADGIRHIHSHFATNACAVAMLAHAMGGPTYSFTAHGPDEFDHPDGNSIGLKVRRSAFAVAISDFCRVQLARFSGMPAWPKLLVSRCGLKLEDFAIDAAAFDTDPAFDPANKQMVCIGRLCMQKAQLLIPPALAQLRAKHPTAKVHFIGDGDIRAELEAGLRAHGVQDMAVLHGWQANSAVRALLRQCRLMLLPSFAEGLPIVIMEALALGRPVVSTYIAGIPELVDAGCGWIVPAGSVEQLVLALDDALSAPTAELAAKAREGRARIERLHDQRANSRALFERFSALG